MSTGYEVAFSRARLAAAAIDTAWVVSVECPRAFLYIAKCGTVEVAGNGLVEVLDRLADALDIEGAQRAEEVGT